MSAVPTRRRTWAAVALCAAAFLYVFPYYPTINNPNENVRHYMTVALVEQGTYEISEPRQRWGWTNDAAVYEGRIYSVKAPGTSLLGVPAYAAYYWGTQLFDTTPDRTVSIWLCRLTASILPALIFLFFFYRWLGRQTDEPLLRDATFLSVALGSLLYGYALLFVSHTTSAVVGFGAFMILVGAREEKRLSWRAAFAAGLLSASVTLFEYPGLMVSVVLSVFALFAIRPWKRLLAFAVGAALPTLVVMHFQWSAFGSPFRPGHLFVETAALRDAHLEGVYGATGFHLDAAVNLLFHPAYGLFPLTPLLAFAFIGFPALLVDRRKRATAMVALGCILSTWLVICVMNNWRGGWTIGPRYLAAIVPFVAWGALHGLSLLWRRAPRATAVLALGTTAAGLVASGLPSAYYPHLPEDIVRPLPQVFAILVAHDFAPYDAGNLLGWTGTLSMVPLLLLGAGALLWAVPRQKRAQAAVTKSGKGTRLGRVLLFAGGCTVGVLLLLPLAYVPGGAEANESVALITRTWRPEGNDAAARLSRHIAESGQVTPEDYRRLADLYFAEGREREARNAIRRGQLAAQRDRVLRDRRREP